MKGNYSAVAAKLKAIEGARLKEEDYEELLSKSSVQEIYTFLASHSSYREVLSGMTREQLHRSEIEKHLRHEMLREYGRVYHFMDLDRKHMLEFWFYRREIEFLKRGLRHLYNHETSEWIEDEDEFEEFFERHTRLDCRMIEQAETLDKLIEACRDTRYAAILRRAQSIGADYFTVSMMLDKSYYSGVWKAKDKYLSGEDRKLFADAFGMEMDMNNILWIYRGKKYFNIPPEAIYTLIPHRYRLTEETLRSMISASSANEVVELAKQTPYRSLFDGLDEGFFPEENVNRIHRRKAISVLSQTPESMAAVYAYFNLKEIEIYNITTLIESIRYSLDKQTIRRHINIQ